MQTEIDFLEFVRKIYYYNNVRDLLRFLYTFKLLSQCFRMCLSGDRTPSADDVRNELFEGHGDELAKGLLSN